MTNKSTNMFCGEVAIRYLLFKNGRYYFHRRIPKEIKEYDPRQYVRFGLKTDSYKEAVRLVVVKNDQLEAYWNELVQTGQKHSEVLFNSVVKRAQLFGFTYVQRAALSIGPIDQIIERALHVEKQSYNEHHVKAVLGSVEPPKITITEALNKFWSFAKDQTIGKSSNQYRKWQNPRISAVENFIHCVGDKELTKLTREDSMKFRDWWIDRIVKENLKKNSANKNFRHVKAVIESSDINLKLGLDIKHIFGNIGFQEDDNETRPPIETDWLVNKLLRFENFTVLDSQAMWAIFAFAETGAGLAELLSLLPEDIYLDTEVPYISIKRRMGKSSKTLSRPRDIPLVGFALDAFKACPDGFTDYLDKPDQLSSIIGDHLRKNKLFPTEEHTLYSLRHSFQDRLTDVDAPDRVQAELMGHKFNRQKYGKGPTLAKKLEWMKKIQLRISS